VGTGWQWAELAVRRYMCVKIWEEMLYHPCPRSCSCMYHARHNIQQITFARQRMSFILHCRRHGNPSTHRNETPRCYGFASARHASTANPTLSHIISIRPNSSLLRGDLPSLLQPHNIINNITIQLRKHTLQRLHHNFMFLRLDPPRLLRFSRRLARRSVFRRVALLACLVFL
jgi:hypothetical protein